MKVKRFLRYLSLERGDSLNESSLILFLQIIKNNGSIENLVQRGYEYSQIALLLSDILEEGYAEYEDDFIVITESGKRRLLELSNKYNRFNSSVWISPQEQYMIKNIEKFDIYLPCKF